MNQPLFFDELKVGDRWDSRGRTVTEADVASFAGLTGDYDPLHVDQEFAKQTPFGRTVAHGLLGLSFLAGLSSTSPLVMTEAFVSIRSWEFRAPIYPGDTVHAVTEIVELESTSKRRGRVTWLRKLMNQNDDVVQEGVFETLVAVSSLKGREALRLVKPRIA